MNQNDDWEEKHDNDGAQKTDANVDGPALLPSVGSKRARRAPPNPPPHNLPPSFPTQEQLMVLTVLHVCVRLCHNEIISNVIDYCSTCCTHFAHLMHTV